MPALETPQADFGAKAIDFTLPATEGGSRSLADCCGEKGVLVMFICNHCPYVQSIVKDLVADCRKLQQAGLGIVAICSNDAETYPDDSFENMQRFAEEHGFTFPYLHDEDQHTARAYGAVCTPDFFGYNAVLELQYRGRFDDCGRNREAPGHHELLEAMQTVIETGKGPQQQIPSIGCSIKWKAV